NALDGSDIGAYELGVSAFDFPFGGLIAADSFDYSLSQEFIGQNGGYGFNGPYTGGGYLYGASIGYVDAYGNVLDSGGYAYYSLSNNPATRVLSSNNVP